MDQLDLLPLRTLRSHQRRGNGTVGAAACCARESLEAARQDLRWPEGLRVENTSGLQDEMSPEDLMPPVWICLEFTSWRATNPEKTTTVENC